MKLLQKTRNSTLLILWFFVTGISVSAQDSADSAVAEPSVILRYFIDNNSIQYLLVRTGIKTGNKFQALPAQVVKIFLDSNSAENLVAKTYTDENGKAKVMIPLALKDKWNTSSKHTFIGVLEATSPEDERTTSIETTKARILIDTSSNDGARSVNVKVMFLENNEWMPASDVEMKVGVSRSASILSVGDEDTYTTDSTGMVTAEFKKDSLPGDQHGNIILLAKVEDNDIFGNLLVEKAVPWGIAVKAESGFFEQRTLWSTRFRTPAWLLFMAYSIVISVWSFLIYLVFQIVKIKQLSVKDQA